MAEEEEVEEERSFACPPRRTEHDEPGVEGQLRVRCRLSHLLRRYAGAGEMRGNEEDCVAEEYRGKMGLGIKGLVMSIGSFLSLFCEELCVFD